MKIKKKIAACVLAGAFLLGGCGGSKLDEPVIPEGYVRVDIPEESNGKQLRGIGVHFDSHLFTYVNQAPFSGELLKDVGPITEEDWDLICSRAKLMGFDNIRTMVYPEWFEPVNDNDDPSVIDWDNLNFETEGMKALRRILDFCQENDVAVNATFWGPNADLTSWNNPPWVTSFTGVPKDAQEYAESMTIFVKWCRDNGYTCLREITPYNEPNWAYKNGEGQVVMVEYLEMCKALHDRLTAEGVRDQIQLNLSDSSISPWSLEVMEQLNTPRYKGIADLVNTHCYDFSPGSSPESIKTWSKTLSGKATEYGWDHVINEFATAAVDGSHITSGIDTYTRGVFLGNMVTGLLNGGSTGMVHWVLHDMVYHIPNYLMQYGLWAYKTEGWRCRPAYYAYSLMTHFTERGVDIFPVELQDDNFSATALRNSDGKWTLIAVNSGNFAADMSFVFPENEISGMKAYVYEDGSLPDDGSLIPAKEEVAVTSRTLNYELPAQSVVVFSNLE